VAQASRSPAGTCRCEWSWQRYSRSPRRTRTVIGPEQTLMRGTPGRSSRSWGSWRRLPWWWSSWPGPHHEQGLWGPTRLSGERGFGAGGPALGAHEVVDAAVGDEAAHDAVVVVTAVEMQGLELAERHPWDGFHSGNKRVVLWSLQVEGWRRHGSGGGGQARTASRCAPARRTTAPSTYESGRALGAAVRTASPGSALWAAGADRPPRARPPLSAQ
jgi:hypothetical protein